MRAWATARICRRDQPWPSRNPVLVAWLEGMPSHPTPRTHDSTCFHRPRRPWSNPVCPLQQGAQLDVLQCPRKPHFARACAPTLRKPSVARRRQSAASRLWVCICACVGSRYHPPHNACFVTMRVACRLRLFLQGTNAVTQRPLPSEDQYGPMRPVLSGTLPFCLS